MNEMDLKFNKIVIFPFSIEYFRILEILFDSIDIFLRHSLIQGSVLKLIKCPFSSLLNILFCLFVLLLYMLIKIYGHGGTVSSPNHTFSWASLNKQLTSNSCTYFLL